MTKTAGYAFGYNPPYALKRPFFGGAIGVLQIAR
jgi:hypothetical protein